MAARRTPIAPLPPAGEVLRARYAGRLPERLEDLAGPVELPLQVAGPVCARTTSASLGSG